MNDLLISIGMVFLFAVGIILMILKNFFMSENVRLLEEKRRSEARREKWKKLKRERAV